MSSISTMKIRRDARSKLTKTLSLLRSKMTKAEREAIDKEIASLRSTINNEVAAEIDPEELKSRREFLATNPGLHDIFEAIWLIMLPHTENGVLTKAGYSRFYQAISVALVGKQSFEDITANLDIDWATDVRIFGQLDKTNFMDFLFETIEVYAGMVNPHYYAAFTWALLDSIADTSSHPPKLRPLREISCITKLDNEANVVAAYIRDKKLRSALTLETKWLARVPEVQLRLQGRRKGTLGGTHQREMIEALGRGGSRGGKGVMEAGEFDDEEDADDPGQEQQAAEDEMSASLTPSLNSQESEEQENGQEEEVGNLALPLQPPPSRYNSQHRRTTKSFMEYVKARKGSILALNGGLPGVDGSRGLGYDHAAGNGGFSGGGGVGVDGSMAGGGGGGGGDMGNNPHTGGLGAGTRGGFSQFAMYMLGVHKKRGGAGGLGELREDAGVGGSSVGGMMAGGMTAGAGEATGVGVASYSHMPTETTGAASLAAASMEGVGLSGVGVGVGVVVRKVEREILVGGGQKARERTSMRKSGQRGEDGVLEGAAGQQEAEEVGSDWIVPKPLESLQNSSSLFASVAASSPSKKKKNSVAFLTVTPTPMNNPPAPYYIELHPPSVVQPPKQKRDSLVEGPKEPRPSLLLNALSLPQNADYEFFIQAAREREEKDRRKSRTGLLAASLQAHARHTSITPVHRASLTSTSTQDRASQRSAEGRENKEADCAVFDDEAVVAEHPREYLGQQEEGVIVDEEISPKEDEDYANDEDASSLAPSVSAVVTNQTPVSLEVLQAPRGYHDPLSLQKLKAHKHGLERKLLAQHHSSLLLPSMSSSLPPSVPSHLLPPNLTPSLMEMVGGRRWEEKETGEAEGRFSSLLPFTNTNSNHPGGVAASLTQPSYPPPQMLIYSDDISVGSGSDRRRANYRKKHGYHASSNRERGLGGSISSDSLLITPMGHHANSEGIPSPAPAPLAPKLKKREKPIFSNTPATLPRRYPVPLLHVKKRDKGEKPAPPSPFHNMEMHLASPSPVPPILRAPSPPRDKGTEIDLRAATKSLIPSRSSADHSPIIHPCHSPFMQIQGEGRSADFQTAEKRVMLCKSLPGVNSAPWNKRPVIESYIPPNREVLAGWKDKIDLLKFAPHYPTNAFRQSARHQEDVKKQFLTYIRNTQNT